MPEYIDIFGFILFDLRKFWAAEDLIPKLIPSVLSLAKPETAIATRLPFSLIIGPPLFPGLIGASICNSFELSSNPFKELTIPDEILRSSLKPLPSG
jgi:hypothetical protein